MLISFCSQREIDSWNTLFYINLAKSESCFNTKQKNIYNSEFIHLAKSFWLTCYYASGSFTVKQYLVSDLCFTWEFFKDHCVLRYLKELFVLFNYMTHFKVMMTNLIRRYIILCNNDTVFISKSVVNMTLLKSNLIFIKA